LKDILCTIPIVSLREHDLFCYDRTLLNSAETNDVCKSRVCFFIAVRYPHTATDSNIEASQFSPVIDNGNEAQVICKDIDVISRWNRNRDFELSQREEQLETSRGASIPFGEDRTRRRAARSL
jgi:hypothetical protein